jgi:hypothetical protein
MPKLDEYKYILFNIFYKTLLIKEYAKKATIVSIAQQLCPADGNSRFFGCQALAGQALAVDGRNLNVSD